MLPSFVILILFPILSCSQNIQQFRDCATKLYSCGQAIYMIGYPFWGNHRPSYCGMQGFQLTCQEDGVTTLQIVNTTFRVLRLDDKHSRIHLALNELWGKEPDACSLRPNESINVNTFQYTSFSYYPNQSLFLGLYLSCPEDEVRSIKIRNRLNCSGDHEGGIVSFFEDRMISLKKRCARVISAPVSTFSFSEFKQSETMSLVGLLKRGFEMKYTVDGGESCSLCQSSGGTCWSNSLNSTAPSCVCPDGVARLRCRTSGSLIMWRIKLVLGVGLTVLSFVLILILYFIKKSSPNHPCVVLFKHKNEDEKSVETFVTQYRSLSMKRYTYADIKKMTNSFKVKLGQGGFGSVFKGKLSDGRLVAVKVLNSSKASGQEFINEVASIGRTAHINIISLLGFCCDYQKRALVYEFMPNGSLEKFKYHHTNQSTSKKIEVDKLFTISLGIARGLDYLHRGCNTCILHLDIKPHNILLDEDFCPKIADFGLAKLHSRKESIVSMLEARGTIGYIPPEVFNRNFGGVSHKSDVYSYGMLILEMVGGRKNVDVGVGFEDTSEMYFPNWIYTRLKKDEFLFDGVRSLTEDEYVRKMSIVGLWCIQTNPKKRPSINEVIEMLEGSMEALEIPPKPFFFSPPGSPATMCNTSQEAE